MSTTSTLENGLVVDFSPLATKVSDEEFAELYRLNPELQFERTSKGELGWLIDPSERTVHVYRAGAAPEVLEGPQEVSGEPLLKGFVLDVQALWD